MFYKIIEDYAFFKEGSVLLLGDRDIHPEIGMCEFFDITREMTTGHSYTTGTDGDIPMDMTILYPYDDKRQKELKKLLSDFIKNGYALNNEILNY